MSTRHFIGLTMAALLWFAPCHVASQGGVPDVSLYMPALASDGPLGLRAATVLNLQIWQTLRRAPYPNPGRLSFGNGVVVWSPAPLDEESHDGAVREARSVGADMVLWGKAWRYGGGVTVQAYLTVVDDAGNSVRRWIARVPQPGEPLSLSVGLPRSRYEFAPIVLEPGVVDSLSSPEGLQILAEKGSSRGLGEVGMNFRALQHDGAWTRVQSGSVQGWVHLPQLSRRRSEIVDFVGGVIRILRTDWDGAAQLFDRVIANSGAPHALKVDAHLMRALALSHLGRDRLGEIRKAYVLNPHEVTTTKYECMEYVARLAGNPDAATARQLRQKLTQILDERRYVYSQQDPWFAKVRRLAGDGQ